MTALTSVPTRTSPSPRSPRSRRVDAGTVRPPRGELRLTRRGRLVVSFLMLIIVAVAAVLFSSRSVATGQGGDPEATRTVVVDRGDTLWQIAADVAPAGEIREMVHRIEKLNALPGPALAEGQEIAVPLG